MYSSAPPPDAVILVRIQRKPTKWYSYLAYAYTPRHLGLDSRYVESDRLKAHAGVQGYLLEPHLERFQQQSWRVNVLPLRLQRLVT